MHHKLLYLNRNEYFFNHPPMVIDSLTIKDSLKLKDEIFISHYAISSELEKLKTAIANKYNVMKDYVLLGHGAEDIFVKILSWFRKEIDSVVIEDFSWTNYLHFAEGFNYQVHTIPTLKIDNDFSFNNDEFYKQLSLLNSAIVFITSPNNPTGHTADLNDICNLASIFPQHIFILDSVYNEIVNNQYAHLFKFKNIILIGSFSKFFGMPGLRLGYAIGSLPKAFQLNLGLQPSAIQFAQAALNNFDYYQNNRNFMLSFASSLLNKSFKNVEIYKTAAPFFLAKVTNNVENFEQAERESGVVPKYIWRKEGAYLRFGLGPQEICEKVEIYLSALK